MPESQNSAKKANTGQNSPAYVIGGGPSLKGYDFLRLRGRPCYGANRAAFDVPWGQLISIDRDFCQNFSSQIACFGDRAHLAPPDNVPRHLNPHARHYGRDRYGDIFDGDPATLPGLNSGFAAFVKAIRDGHRSIALLGIDMIPNAGHYHSGYSWNTKKLDGITREWIAAFDRAAVECEKRGVQVVNFSVDSAVTGFPKMPLDQLFYDTFEGKEGPL